MNIEFAKTYTKLQSVPIFRSTHKANMERSFHTKQLLIHCIKRQTDAEATVNTY